MNNALNRHRAKIEKLDAVIINTLASRFDVARKIGKIKAQKKLPIIDLTREKRQKAMLLKLAKQLNISPIVIFKIFKIIVNESKRIQKYGK